MGTIVAPSTLISDSVTSLPTSPVSGKFIQLSTTGDTYVYQNGMWVGIEGATYILPYTGNVIKSSAVVIETDTARLANASIHSRCDGLCIDLFDEHAIIRTAGLVLDLQNLVMGSNYYLDTIDGEMTASPSGGNTVLIGSAVGTSSLLLKLGVSVKYG